MRAVKGGQLTISLGDDAACMNQSSIRKSLIGLLSVAPVCGHCVPGNRRKKPVLEPKYCHDSAASRSKLLANIGSKCCDQAIDDRTSGSVYRRGQNGRRASNRGGGKKNIQFHRMVKNGWRKNCEWNFTRYVDAGRCQYRTMR